MTVFCTFRSVSLGLAIAMMSRSAQAQICTGAAPFSSGLVRIGAGGGRIGAGFGGADSKPSLGLRLSLGATKGPFATLGASIALYSSSSSNPFIRGGLAKDTLDDASSGNASLSGGYGFSLSASRKVELCPIAGLSNQRGPSFAECSPLPGAEELRGKRQRFGSCCLVWRQHRRIVQAVSGTRPRTFRRRRLGEFEDNRERPERHG